MADWHLGVCDVCRAHGDTSTKIVFHCNACDADICMQDSQQTPSAYLRRARAVWFRKWEKFHGVSAQRGDR